MLQTVLAALRPRVRLVKYAATSLAVYVYIFAALYALVSWAGMPELMAYVLVYAGAYLLEYTATLRLVFAVQHRWRMVVKYGVYVAGFFGINTALYAALIREEVHYLLAAFLVALVLMPARYLVNKHWVYR
jgi:putative flippase GtrA